MIQCRINHLGEDDVILVTGGTKPHVGAVVIAVWEESGQPNLISYSLPGHKEEELFSELAKVWCSTFRKNVVISGGIHVDNATKKDIEDLVDAAWESFFNLMADHKLVSEKDSQPVC